MLRINKRVYSPQNKKFRHDLVVDVKVRSNGLFYAHVPVFLKESIHAVEIGIEITKRKTNKETDYDVRADTFAKLEQLLVEATEIALTAKRETEHVIVYNIALHCTFAVKEDGTTAHNSVDGEWNNDKIFGNHTSINLSKGGFGICIGAEARTKITDTFGEHTEVKYERYNGEGDTNWQYPTTPAGILNSWNGFYIGDTFKEIPYTDEAAIFFDGIMKGIVSMSRNIAKYLGSEEDVLRAIDVGAIKMLGGAM